MVAAAGDRGDDADHDDVEPADPTDTPMADAGMAVRVAVGHEETEDEAAAPKRTGLVAPRKPKPKTEK